MQQLFYSPEQPLPDDVPSPSNPAALHTHSKLPWVLLHVAMDKSQLCAPVVHSSISVERMGWFNLSNYHIMYIAYRDGQAWLPVSSGLDNFQWSIIFIFTEKKKHNTSHGSDLSIFCRHILNSFRVACAM